MKAKIVFFGIFSIIDIAISLYEYANNHIDVSTLFAVISFMSFYIHRELIKEAE